MTQTRQTQLQIGGIRLANPIILAPMAGVTDRAFREIVQAFQPGLLYTEMVSAKALVYQDKKTATLIDPTEWAAGSTVPRALQIFGSEPEFMARAAAILEAHPAEILDINMGCPAPKIVRNGEGAALMRTMDRAEAVIRAVVGATSKPVTVKFRKGWDDNTINAVEFAQMAEVAGASALTIHGRTREQFYSGTADYSCIGAVKAAVTIPVIGNGDLFSVAALDTMAAETGCDGFMVGRGALGNPWLLGMLVHHWKGEAVPALPELTTRMAVAKRHMDLLVAYKGSRIGVLEMRKHAAWYLKGIPGTGRLRGQTNLANTAEEMGALLDHAATGRDTPHPCV